MKGVVLAAGKGTRLYPITKEISKMILPIYDKPVIYYPVNVLVNSGITEIIIVTNKKHLNQIKSVVLDEPTFGKISFFFKVKDHDLGMPYSILQTKKWVGSEAIMVVPGDNLFTNSYIKEVSEFKRGAIAHLTKVKDPERFGTIVKEKGKIIDLVEKPIKAQSKVAITAPYFFDNSVFDYIKTLKPSKRGELEIIDLLKTYFSKGMLSFHTNHGYWKDIGTHEALLEAGIFFRNRSKKVKRF